MPVLGLFLADYPGRLQALGGVGRRHPDVGHHQLGPGLPDQREQVRAVAGLPDHREAGAIEQAGQALPEQDIVLAQDNPQAAARHGLNYRLAPLAWDSGVAPLHAAARGGSLDNMAGGLRRVSLGASSRLRRQLPTLARWPRGWRGRFGAEIVLAVIVAIAAFTVAAAVGTAARYHVPVPLFSLVLLLCVLAVARFAGVLYALPVGVVTILAFDWYFLPPLRQLNGATVLVLGLFLVMSVVVGAFATLAARRAAGSEAARGVLADQQAALRRVATLVARQPSRAEVFAAVTEEVGQAPSSR